MANLSNINNKFLVTTGGNVLIGQTAAIGSSLLQVNGSSTLAGRVTVEATSAVTNGVVDTLVVKALSSGTITNGFGVGLSFYNENTVYSAVNEVGKIAVIETDTTAIDDKMVFFVKDNNTLAERLTLNGSEAIFTGNVIPSANPGGELGTGSYQWSELNLSSSAGIIWGNGDASIVEGTTENYSLSFNTYDGTSSSRALYLQGNNNATFTGTVTAPNLNLTALTNNASSTSVLVLNQILGNELIINGDFDTSLDWAMGSQWSIANGKASYTSSTTGRIYQSLTLANATEYRILFTVSGATGSSAYIWIGNSAGNTNYLGASYKFYGNGTHEEVFTMPSAQTTLAFYSQAASSDFSLDIVSLKEVLATGTSVQKREISSNAFAEELWEQNDNGINNIGGVNVGIGTATPGEKLQLKGNGTYISVIASDNSNAVKLGTDSSGDGLLQLYSDAGVNNIKLYGEAASPSYINAGNVGIGTTSPDNKLTVKDTNCIIDAQSTGDGQTIGFRAGYLNHGTLAGFFRYTTGDAQLYIDNDFTGNNGLYSDINFRNKANGGTSLINRMKIKGSTGYVGIGTTSPGTFLQLGSYPVSGTYVNNATYPDVPSEHMIHLTAPSTTGYFGGGISFGENAFTAANITAVDAGGGGALHLAFGTGNSSGMTERMRIASNGDITMQENLFFNNGAAFRSAASIRQQSDILILTGGGNGFAFNDDTNAVSNLLINAGGEAIFSSNVAIGNTTVRERLTVSGKVYIEETGVNWNETTPGLAIGTQHFDPIGAGTDNTGNAITFGASDSGGGATAQSGIYTRSDGTYGTKMYFATSDSYAVGSKTRMMIDYTGNVGIGTSSPDQKLEVVGSIKIANSNSRLVFGSAGGTDRRALEGNTAGSLLQVGESYTDIALQGDVGIGTTSPDSLLQLESSANADVELKISNTATVTSGQNFGGSKIRLIADGTNGDGEGVLRHALVSETDSYSNWEIRTANEQGTLAFDTLGSERMRITSDGYVAIPDDAGNHSGAASLIVTAKASIPYQIWNYSGTSTSFKLQLDQYVTAGNVRQYFNQINAGVSHGFSMTFNTGSVIFGDLEVASATQNSGSAFKKDSKARMTLCQGSNSTALTDLQEYFNPNGAVGKIQTSGSATLFTTSSDYRLKEDLKSFSGLEVISKIPVYDFKWKISDERGYGVMAHELQEVLPQAVGGDKDYEKDHVVKEAKYDDNHNLIKEAEYGKRPSYQTVDYSKIVPLLVKSIQELKAEIELLKSK